MRRWSMFVLPMSEAERRRACDRIQFVTEMRMLYEANDQRGLFYSVVS